MPRKVNYGLDYDDDYDDNYDEYDYGYEVDENGEWIFFFLFFLPYLNFVIRCQSGHLVFSCWFALHFAKGSER